MIIFSLVELMDVQKCYEFFARLEAGASKAAFPSWSSHRYAKVCESRRVSDSVTRRIGAANVGLRYLATLNKLTRQGCHTCSP